MTTINYTDMNTMTDVILNGPSQASAWFWTAAVWMIFIVVWITVINYGLLEAFMVASFFGIVASILALYMGTVNVTYTVGVFIAILLLSFLLKIFKSK